jgi:hypothetical protein
MDRSDKKQVRIGLAKRNNVARVAWKFNKPKVFKDRKKEAKNNNWGDTVSC